MTEFTVRYQEINSFREMTPVSILNCLEEAAILNSEAIGLGIQPSNLHSIREGNQELAAGRTVWRKRQCISTSP